MKHEIEKDVKTSRLHIQYTAILEPVVKHFENDTVCLIFDRLPTWICTSTVGLEILRMFNKKPTSISEVLTNVACEYSIPVEMIETDILQFVDRLIFINAIVSISDNINERTPLSTKKTLSDRACESANMDIKILCSMADKLGKFKPFLFENDQLKNLLREVSATGLNTVVSFFGYNTETCDSILSSIKKMDKSEVVKYAVSSFPHEVTYEEIKRIKPYVAFIELVFASLEPALYDDIHGEGSFAKAIDFVQNAIKLNRASISVALCASTAKETDWVKFPAFAREFGFQSARVGGSELYNSMYSGKRSLEFSCVSHFKQVLKYNEKLATQRATQLQETPRKDLVDFETIVPFVPGNSLLNASKANCPGGLSSLTFLPDGSCFPCSSLIENEGCKIGNYPTTSYLQLRNEGIIWNSNVFNVDKDPKCSICCYRYFCGGGCRAAAAEIGTFDSRCELFIAEYDRILSLAAFFERKESSLDSSKTLEDYSFGAFSNCCYS